MTSEQPSARTEPSMRWLTWLVVGLVIVLVWTLAINPATPGPVGPDREAAALMLGWVAEERAAHDLPPLTPADDIAMVAERWSAAMADARLMEHNPTFGQEICCWSSVTENVAFGEAYPIWRPGDPIARVTRELHEGLMSSPGHRANLLDPNVDQVGIGVHIDRDGTIWITQNFRRHLPGER